MTTSIPNRGPQLEGVNYLFLIIVVLTMLLRIYVRIFMVKKFGADDWVMLLAAITFSTYCACSIAGVNRGTGRHQADLTYPEITDALHFWWFCYLFYSITMIASKISIGVFLLRIVVQRVHSIIIYLAMSGSVIAGLIFFFVTMFQCRPIPYFWDKALEGSCLNINIIIGLAFVYSTFSVVSDLTFALFPIFLVSQLQIKRRTKLALIPLLAMGCIASFAVVIRFPYLLKLRDPDFLWATVDIAIWATVEQGLAITAGSLVTLRPLFKIVAFRCGFGSEPSHMRQSERISSGRRRGGGRSGGLSGNRDGGVGLEPSPKHNNPYNLNPEASSACQLTPSTAASEAGFAKSGLESGTASINRSEEDFARLHLETTRPRH